MLMTRIPFGFFFFFFNDTATTEIYTLSLHDALPILTRPPTGVHCELRKVSEPVSDQVRIDSRRGAAHQRDRKSTRLNSSHSQISYAVFCLKKKKNDKANDTRTSTSSLNYNSCGSHPV